MNLVSIPVVPKKYCGFIRTNLKTGGAIAPIELALDTTKANLDFDNCNRHYSTGDYMYYLSKRIE